MGIISSALAAAGDAGVQSMNQNIQQLNQQELDRQRSDLETQKQLAIMQAQKQLTIDTANQMREAQVARINAAVPGAVQNQLDAKYADANAAAAGQTDAPLTPEQQAVIDQSKATDKAALASDPHAYIKAAMATGDIDPHTVAQLAQQEDALRRQEAAQQAQFEHADNAQEAAQKFAALQQTRSQQFQAGQQAAQMAATRENLNLTHNLDPMTIETNAKAIAAGQMPPLTGIALRSPSGAQTMARVLELKPDYSAKDYGTGAKAEKDFATGKQGNMVRSFNVALSHLDTLSNLAGALNNGDTQAINKFGNFVATQTGSPAPTNFESVKHIVADEIVKAVTGGAGALGDREAAAKVIDAANSPAQLQGVISSYKELMKGQLNGLREQYTATTGKSDFDTKYLSDAARAVGHNSSTVQNPLLPSTPGAALTYDPKTGTFH